MQIPLAFLDLAAIEEVPIEVWRELFEAEGWPPSLATMHDTFGHDDILHAFGQDTPGDGLLLALEALDCLGTEAGREAVVAAMQDRRVAIAGLPPNLGEREFALRFYLAQRVDASLADVFLRARIAIQEGIDQHRFNEFMGKEAKCIKNLGHKKVQLREEILLHCRNSDLGEHVQVETLEDDDTYIFNILRSHRTKKPLAILTGHSARATIAYRPVHSDVIRYEASNGRLRIAVRAATMVEFYRALLGKILFNDEDFFDGSSVCDLKALQDRGRDALENHGVYGVTRIRMTECLWERGDRNLIQIRSSDCFRTMEELQLPISEGTLLQAKLKLDVIGKSTRPVIVNIRVPCRIEVSQKSKEDLVEKVLNAIGVRGAAPLPSAANLWSLHPWRHPLGVWRTVFASMTDELIQERVLIPIQLSAVPHPDYPNAGHVLEAHAVSDGDFYGVSDVPEIPSRSLTATDLDGLELHPEQFRLYLRTRLGIMSGGCRWDNCELLELGFVDVGGDRIYAVYALQQPQPGIGDKLRAHADGAHPVLLFPSPEADAAELAHVLLGSALPTRQALVRQAVNACGLDATLPAIHTAPDGARLVVDTRIGKVWVDGIEIHGLSSDSQPFKFVVFMARSSMPVTRDEIVNAISPGRQRQDEDTAARQAKSRTRELIAESMTAVGRSLDEDPFPAAGRGFYRCALPPYVR